MNSDIWLVMYMSLLVIASYLLVPNHFILNLSNCICYCDLKVTPYIQ